MRAGSTIIAVTLLLPGLLAVPAPSEAVPCSANPVSSLGNASTDDVSLGGSDANDCHVYDGNAQAGPNGDPSGFSGAFGSGWSLLAKVNSGGTISDISADVPLTPTFTQIDGTSGTWSLTSSQPLLIDLVFAMHAGGRTGAFLFDDHAFLQASLSQDGDWLIEWLNGGGQVPDYSNLTLFWRDQRFPSQEISEPGTLTLLAAILAGGAFWRTRRRKPWSIP
jgi:hypothetical protein